MKPFKTTLGRFALSFCLALVSSVAYCQSPSDSTLSLLFIGDIMGHDSQINAAYNSRTGTYDYSDVFTYLGPELANADFTLANLEVTLAGPPYKGYPQFSSPDVLAADAKAHGIDILVTANNHSADRRNAGIRRTLAVLDSLNIGHTGTFLSAQDRKANNLLVMEQNGIRIGLLNYTFSTNGIPVPAPEIVNRIDRDQMKADVADALTQNLDKLIVFTHWGREYEHSPHSAEVDLTTYLYDLGVDYVIGAHPHVLQPMEWDTQQDRLVAYSLGNFVSNQRDPGRDGGTMLRLVLKRKHGEVRLVEAGYQLIWVYKRYDPKLHFHVIPCSAFEAWPEFFETEGSYAAFLKFTRDARHLLNTENLRVPEYRWVAGAWRVPAPFIPPLQPRGGALSLAPPKIPDTPLRGRE